MKYTGAHTPSSKRRTQNLPFNRFSCDYCLHRFCYVRLANKWKKLQQNWKLKRDKSSSIWAAAGSVLSRTLIIQVSKWRDSDVLPYKWHHISGQVSPVCRVDLTWCMDAGILPMPPTYSIISPLSFLRTSNFELLSPISSLVLEQIFGLVLLLLFAMCSSVVRI